MERSINRIIEGNLVTQLPDYARQRKHDSELLLQIQLGVMEYLRGAPKDRLKNLQDFVDLISIQSDLQRIPADRFLSINTPEETAEILLDYRKMHPESFQQTSHEILHRIVSDLQMRRAFIQV